MIPVSIEVSASEVIRGIVEVNGSIDLREEALVFTYREKNMILKDPERVRVQIPIGAIQDLTIKRGVTTSKIILHPNTLDVFREMPGGMSNKLVLQVQRGYREEAERLVDAIQDLLADRYRPSMDSIPFKLADTNFGMTEHAGMVRLEDEFLTFEIESKVIGLFRQDSQTIKIETRALEEVYLKKGVLKDLLRIYPKRMDLLDALPGNNDICVTLKISRKQRRETELLVDRLEQVIGIGGA